MSPATHPAAVLLLAAITSLALLPGVARAQGPSVAGTQSAGTGSPSAIETVTPPTQSHSAPQTSDEQAAALAAAAAAVKPSLADLAWLTGNWQGAWGPRVAQQAWAPPKAGVMLGSFQLTENDKTLVIELFTLAETPDGIELRIRHFTPSLVPWEKNGPTVLRLFAIDAKSAVFENPTNGEPKKQSFRRIDGDTFTSRSEVVPPEGDPQVAEIIFHRVRGEVAPAKHKPTKTEK